MARLIDADALYDDVMERYCKDCEKRKGIKRGKWRVIYEIGEAPCRACDVDDLKMELDETPTIEAEPIRHGRWIPSDPPDAPITKLYKCSVCGLGYEDDDTDCEVYYPWNYCPHCGAKMDEVEE